MMLGFQLKGLFENAWVCLQNLNIKEQLKNAGNQTQAGW
jgi:hypothetical protein